MIWYVGYFFLRQRIDSQLTEIPVASAPESRFIDPNPVASAKQSLSVKQVAGSGKVEKGPEIGR
jgi:hypothetical protein